MSRGSMMSAFFTLYHYIHEKEALDWFVCCPEMEN